MPSLPRKRVRRGRLVGVLSLLIISGWLSPCFADYTLDTANDLFKTGQYESCAAYVRESLNEWQQDADWAILLIKSLVALGQYDEASDQALHYTQEAYPLSLTLANAAHTAFQHNHHQTFAQLMDQRIYRIASARQLEYMNSADLVAVGRTLLRLNGEPRLILDEFYNRAIRKDPNCLEAYLASGDLALAKQDFELAAEQFRKALDQCGDDPQAHVGLARAFYHSDRKAMLQSLDTALQINPHCADALNLLAEHHIDAESYDQATEILERVLEVNPWNPETWALRTVIANLTNDPYSIAPCRGKALKFWPDNPRVDYLIGKKLSQKYRFSEGADYQRRSLEFDETYLPAKAQLAQDLLRLGDAQGWDMASDVYEADQYNILAYNLVNLHDEIRQFATLTTDGFVVRMDPLEAKTYGDRVVQLLERAKSALCDKYGLVLDKPITLELFKHQQDFAVRTFGVPGGDGFLGVCFGDVITANSPKLERRSNWEATLWHEFCHVVTLNLTHNKMPRWLSEGISVYEERQCSPTWGQHMNPQYRRMILGGELTPVSQLSSAFLSPPTPMHLQFAYYQSSLVVEFLVDQYGLEAIKAILLDLGKGEEINSVIARHTTAMGEIEKSFAAFARKRAEALAEEVDWDQPEHLETGSIDIETVTQWLKTHPNSFWALTAQAQYLVGQQQWQQSKAPLNRLIKLYPDYTGEANAYSLLVRVHQELNETEQEYQVLSQWAARSADAVEAYARLMDIEVERQNWDKVLQRGEQYLAVYPLRGRVYEQMARAHEVLEHTDQAVDAYQRALMLDPADPADIHYRLASLYQAKDTALAKRHVLDALADAPRFREAYELLVQLQTMDPSQEVIP